MAKKRIARWALCGVWFKLREEQSSGDEIETHRKLPNGGQWIAIAFEQNLKELAPVAGRAEPNAGTGLRVEVDEKNAPPHVDECAGETDGSGGLPYPTLGIRDGDALH